MAQNEIQTGEKLDLTAPSGGVVDEMAYLIGSLFVVAQATVAEGDTFVGKVGKVQELPKATGYIASEGEILYWDVADEEFNSDSSNPAVAVAVEEAGSSATTVKALCFSLKAIEAAAASARLDDL